MASRKPPKKPATLQGLRAIAKAYGVSPATAHRWIEAGALPVRRSSTGELSAKRVPKREITTALAARAADRKDQRAAEKRARARMFGPTSRKRERDLGIAPEIIEGADIAAFVVNVFAPTDVIPDARIAARVVDYVLDRLLRVLGGDRDVPLRADGTPDPWRGQVTFPRNVTEGEIIAGLMRIDWRGWQHHTHGYRVHFGIFTDERVFVPLTFAHENPKVATTQAIASLERGGAMIDSEKNRRAMQDRGVDRARWKSKKQRQRANERFRATENERQRKRRKRKQERLGSAKRDPKAAAEEATKALAKRRKKRKR